MKLKRLTLQGFKSFKDRTSINFDEGITGIVGPNGCGKSNIVDALFWVMGEMSAKHLRGNSMKDVIFSGSSKYNPGGFAEATLVLENNEGKHIHIGHKVSSPTEIALTRKLYRNGETEYRINGHPCRLRDIQEVFMDTGAGAKSYSIIAQGEINRLVQAKPVERRTMIEEVAGITKFKQRKKESLKKIEQTESNLARLQDLQHEIEKNLKALQKQAEKAERARSLKEKIKRNEIVVNAHKEFDILKDYRDGKNLLNDRSLEIENWGTRKNVLEVSLEEERITKEDKTDKIEQFQKEYNDLSRTLAAAEEKLNYLCQSLTEKEKLLESRETEVSEIEENIKERESKIEELQTKLEEIRSENSEEVEFAELEERCENLKEETEDLSAQVDELKEELELKKSESTELDQQIFKNNNKLEEYAKNLQDITEEIESLETQYSGVSTQINDERDAVNTAETKKSELANKSDELKTETESLQQEFKSLNDQANVKSKELIKLESRINSLKELNEALEGVKQGASTYLKSHEGSGIELFGNLIQCEEEYTKAVQTLLGEFMDALIASDDTDLDAFYSWCADNRDEGLDFIIPLTNASESSESAERLEVNGCNGILKLSDVLKVSEGFQSKIDILTRGYYVVPSLDEKTIKNLPEDISFKSICSMDGKVVAKNNGNGKILSISSGESGLGLVERNNTIEQLEADCKLLLEESTELESKVTELEINLEERKAEFELVRTEFSDISTDYASKKSALESKLSNMETGGARLDILKNRKAEISKSRLELMEEEEGLGSKFNDLKESIDSLSATHEERFEMYEDRKSTYDEVREDLMSKQVAAKTFQERLEAITSQVEDIQTQVEKSRDKKNTTVEMIETYKEEITNIETESKELEASNTEEAAGLQDKEEVLNIMKDELGQLLLAMKEREDETKDLTTKINKAEKEIAQVEVKIDQSIVEEGEIVKNIFEKYKIDLRDSLGRFLEYEEEDYNELVDVSSMYTMETEDGPKEIFKEEYEFNRRYGQDLKDCGHKLKNYRTEFNRLGEINWQAIEDYERQKHRFDFLRLQENELRLSLDDLARAIEHIDTKSRERFKHAFNEVNSRFEKVFPIIFGGGSAELKVIGLLDDPECGVDIIAQPPGKKMVNINLMSGGEKALTAVSLIFSIFLVKPSPFCLLDEVDAPLDDANVGRFNELLREMSSDSQFILITHNKKTMELNDTLYGVTMQEPGVSKAVSVQLH
ncbi:MAG: chromosome segregation protein SMC [Bacteriovoracaceae bacterium]|nr:chromosome segregation protein SMC [Bacteriovoracaceae bacterium]